MNVRTAQDLVTFSGAFAVGLVVTRAAGHGLARLLEESSPRWERGAAVGYVVLFVPPIAGGFLTSLFVPGYEEERWLGTWLALSTIGYVMTILIAVALWRRLPPNAQDETVEVTRHGDG